MYIGSPTGKCYACGVIVTGKKRYCDKCAKEKAVEARKRWRQAMVDIGGCIECGKQSDGMHLCPECRAKQNERKKNQRGILLKKC